MSRNNIADAENFFETASKEELIDYLVKTIQNEVSKGDDADCDLVRECSDWLEELTEDEVTFTPEELEHKLEELKAGSKSEQPIKIRKKATRKTFVRVAFIAAVIFAISLASLSAVAMNKGYGSAWEYVVNNLEIRLGMKEGDAFEEKGISIVKTSGTTYYDCIEDLLANENLNIMLPDKLTTGVDIKGLRIINESDNRFTIYFNFSDSRYTYAIKNYYLVDLTTITATNKENYNGIIEYEVNKIRVSTATGIITIIGSDLTLSELNSDELLVSGLIKNIGLEGNE